MKDNIFEQCPKYISCSVNKCPLSIHYTELQGHKGDYERKCKLSKAKRLAVAGTNKDKLTYGGLTGHEYQGHKNAIYENRVS